MRTKPVIELLILLAVCAAVYFTMLGTGGLAFSEGHRAIPGWTMLESGDWIVPRMFEQAYIRKPPGMPWAIGLSSAILGETALAARLPSALAATLMALVAWFFARRWFGPSAGLPAGLAQALMPWMWESGRAAEIESLNTLGAQIAALAVIDVLLRARRRLPFAVIAVFVGASIALLAKGPASLPVVAAALATSIAFTPDRKPKRISAAIAPLILAGMLFAGWVFLMRSSLTASGELETAVIQSPEVFLWEPGAILAILALPFAAFVASLPASLGLLFPWGPDARRELAGAPEFRTARALAWTWAVSIAISMAVGISNVRYTLPSAPLAPLLVGYVFWAWADGRLTPQRATIARLMSLGRLPILAAVLVGVAALWIGLIERPRRATSGVDQGVAIAREVQRRIGPVGDSLPPEVRLIADGAVEARPEVLWALREASPGTQIIWQPGLAQIDDPNKLFASLEGFQIFLLLRVDPGSAEAAAMQRWGIDTGAETPQDKAPDFEVHEYRFQLIGPLTSPTPEP